METMQLYCKDCSNFPGGMPLQTFELLGPSWSGERIALPFGDPATGPVKVLEVVGWTDLFTGRPAQVHAAHVRWLPTGGPASDGPARPMLGYLVWGGNSGVRVLDPEAEPAAGQEHLPPGWGRPLVWIEDPADLPGAVLAVIDPASEQLAGSEEATRPGDSFTVGEIAAALKCPERAARKLLYDAGHHLDTMREDLAERVPWNAVIDLLAMRPSDRVGRILGELLGKTM